MKNEQLQVSELAPLPVADLRAVPLSALILDKDGAAADLRNKILAPEERLPVAAFQASI